MAYKLNPTTGLLDITGGSLSIPQVTSDPVAPAAESAWVLKTGSGGTKVGGGKILAFLGLAFPYATVGSGGGGTLTYRFSYRTLEGTTRRVQIS